MSRRRGDRHSLAATLAAAYWSRGVSTTDDVLQMLLEARQLSEELGDIEVRGDASAWLVPTYVVLCDHDAARDALARAFAITRQLSQPFLHHVAEHYAAALALCDGDLAAAEAAALRSYEWGRLLTGRDASGTYGIQMFSIRREQGRVGELAPFVRLLDDGALDDAWRPGLVAMLAELGMEDEARWRLRAILDDGVGVPPDVALDRLPRLPRGRVRDARRRGRGRGALPRARRARGHERDGRASRRLLRLDGSLPRLDGRAAR